MIDAYIGIGSNMGDRLGNVAAGVQALAELPDTRLVAVSHAYESAPWGVESQEPFVNAVARIATDLYPDQLLDLLKEAERASGRKPTVRFGPRTLDLDILLFGDEEWARDDLTIPHPRMAEREFVMKPLLEVDPGVRWPDGSSVTADDARLGRVTADLGPVPGFEEYAPHREAQAQSRPREARADLGPEDFKRAQASMDFRVPGRSEPFRTEQGEEWVPLGMARLDPSADVAELVFFEAVLQDARIPCIFYPERPGEGWTGPYRTPRYIDLYVPASRRTEAERVLKEAQEAPNAEP